MYFILNIFTMPATPKTPEVLEPKQISARLDRDEWV
jgi:hypothetical protein